MKRTTYLSLALFIGVSNINSGLWDFVFPGLSSIQKVIETIPKVVRESQKPEIATGENSGSMSINNITVSPVVNVNSEKPEVPSYISVEKIQSSLAAKKELLVENFENANSWIKTHKLITCVSSLGAIYLAALGHIKYLENTLKNPYCWSLWLKHKTLEELYLIPQAEFSTDLLKSIQNVYTTIENPTDFVTPLIRFIEDINKEIRTLETYIYMIKFYNKPYINKIISYDNNIFKDAPVRLNKLIFMKNSFLSWLADYKVSQNNKNFRKLTQYLND